MEAETAVSMVSILISIISLITALVIAVTATKKDAFDNLKAVVSRQADDIERLRMENEDLRGWAQTLVGQLIKAKITPHPYIPRRKAEIKVES